jgi:hypothetical protein
MGRVAQLAVAASERALRDAGLLDDHIRDGRMGVAYGSSGGSIEPVRVMGKMLETGSMQGVTATSYIQMMAHTTAVNVGVFFGLKGRIIPTSSACTSGSQAIGYGYEAIQQGKQKLMLCGGAEELSGPGAAVFDTLFATSTRNDEPSLTPRPFDRTRDGLVVGEGAARWCWKNTNMPGARRDDPRRGDRLRLQFRRQPHHPAHQRNDGGGDAAGAEDASFRQLQRSATSVRTAPPPIAAMSPRAMPPRPTYSARACRSAR